MLLGGTLPHFGSFKKSILPATRPFAHPTLWDVSGINLCLFVSYWRLGESEKAKDQLINLLSRHSESFPKANFAKLFYLMGEKEEALRWLTMAFEYNETQVLSIGVDPNYSEFQSEPQFRELFKKINHPVYVDK